MSPPSSVLQLTHRVHGDGFECCRFDNSLGVIVVATISLHFAASKEVGDDPYNTAVHLWQAYTSKHQAKPSTLPLGTPVTGPVGAGLWRKGAAASG
jgi:hypothetical protein